MASFRFELSCKTSASFIVKSSSFVVLDETATEGLMQDGGTGMCVIIRS